MTPEERRKLAQEEDRLFDTLQSHVDRYPVAVLVYQAQRSGDRVAAFLESLGLDTFVTGGLRWDQQIRGDAYNQRVEIVNVLKAQLRGTAEDIRALRKSAYWVFRWRVNILRLGNGKPRWGASFEETIPFRLEALRTVLKELGEVGDATAE